MKTTYLFVLQELSYFALHVVRTKTTISNIRLQMDKFKMLQSVEFNENFRLYKITT